MTACSTASGTSLVFRRHNQQLLRQTANVQIIIVKTLSLSTDGGGGGAYLFDVVEKSIGLG